MDFKSIFIFIFLAISFSFLMIMASYPFQEIYNDLFSHIKENNLLLFFNRESVIPFINYIVGPLIYLFYFFKK